MLSERTKYYQAVPNMGGPEVQRETAKLLPCVAKLTASKVVSTLPKFSPVYNHSGSNPWKKKGTEKIILD